MRGKFFIDRDLLHHEMWLSEKFSRGQAWLDLLGLANWKPGMIRVRGIRIDLERGDVGWSQRELMKRWRWSQDKFKRFMKELESDGRVVFKPIQRVYTVIQICNYDLYQMTDAQNDTQNDAQTNSQTDNKPIHKPITKKNNKNNNNENKVTTNVVTGGKPQQPLLEVPDLENSIKQSYGNPNVDLVLQCFYRLKGHKPVDKSPRNVAHNLIQRLETIMKSHNIKPNEERTAKWIKLFFQWVMDDSNFVEGVQKLETVKLRTVVWEPVIAEIIRVSLQRRKDQGGNDVQEIVN